MQIAVLLIGVAGVLAADGYLLATRGYDATITAAIRGSSSLSGIVGIGIGYLICHFWG